MLNNNQPHSTHPRLLPCKEQPAMSLSGNQPILAAVRSDCLATALSLPKKSDRQAAWRSQRGPVQYVSSREKKKPPNRGTRGWIFSVRLCLGSIYQCQPHLSRQSVRHKMPSFIMSPPTGTQNCHHLAVHFAVEPLEDLLHRPDQLLPPCPRLFLPVGLHLVQLEQHLLHDRLRQLPVLILALLGV